MNSCCGSVRAMKEVLSIEFVDKDEDVVNTYGQHKEWDDFGDDQCHLDAECGEKTHRSGYGEEYDDDATDAESELGMDERRERAFSNGLKREGRRAEGKRGIDEHDDVADDDDTGISVGGLVEFLFEADLRGE